MVSARAWPPATAERFWRHAGPRDELVSPHRRSTIRLSERPAAYRKSARLLTKAEFQRVFYKAEKSADRYFVVLGRTNNCKRARLGLAISRKCARRALDRNRIKRLVREVFRKSKQDLSDIDFVVICRPGVVGVSSRFLTRSLSVRFKKVRSRLCGLS